MSEYYITHSLRANEIKMIIEQLSLDDNYLTCKKKRANQKKKKKNDDEDGC